MGMQPHIEQPRSQHRNTGVFVQEAGFAGGVNRSTLLRREEWTPGAGVRQDEWMVLSLRDADSENVVPTLSRDAVLNDLTTLFVLNQSRHGGVHTVATLLNEETPRAFDL